ncbi:universal stress protein [Saccharomonospora xinjiangensis]|uniref:universal stress protein n=1 Tax=Saccharomonospora xinjiangensis TaxID=75294 RepID=UPI00106F9DDD|nr:universal stress protein [Saccharomonospora xinjiangensis]QBQ60914.1 Universal stress protein [Saccharomonospora xinjiangensis]
MARKTNKPIVVGVDRSPAARVALEWAIDEALVRDCAVRAVVVWSVDVTREPPWEPVEKIRARHARELDGTLAEVTGGREHLPRIVPVVIEAAPAAGLIEASEGAAMLVVARRAGQWVRRALLGSVSSACVKHARVPVVVIPPSDEPWEGAEAASEAEGSENMAGAEEWPVDEQTPPGR